MPITQALACFGHWMQKLIELLFTNRMGKLGKLKIARAQYGYRGKNAMEWIRKWLDRRRVKALKLKIARMRIEADAAEVEPLMPAVETISHRIRRERLVVLERAAEKIDLLQTSGTQSSTGRSKTDKA